MHAHHQATLDALTEHLKNDPDVIALLLAGSIAKGWERPDSDVDIAIIKSDAAYQVHVENQEFTYFNDSLATYEGGYIDGKVIDKQFLYDVLSHGSEVAKSAFLGAKVVFSRDPEIADLIQQICEYPEAERSTKIRSFATEVLLWGWYVSEAEKRNDRYLLLHSVSELVLFGSRLMLAHNRLLYPYHKWLRKQLEQAPDLPENYFQLMDALLENPTSENAKVYADTVLNFQDWAVPIREAVVIFLQDREWNWRDGKPTIHDW
jgi:predicted nucleotidyltransferase